MPTGVDVSSYPTTPVQVQQQDPLATLGKVLQIQGAQQNLAVQQQEFRARQALGPILQQSIDPQTGELDINKFLINGASNPDVAWKMPEITLQMIQRQNTQADTVVKQLNANKVRYGAMGSAAAALVAEAEEGAQGKIRFGSEGAGTVGNPYARPAGPMQAGTPVVTSKQLAGVLAGFVGENGLIDSKDAAEILSKTADMTDAQRFQYVKRFANSARDIEKVSDATYGAITAHNTGGGTTLMQNRPMIGPPRTVGTLENTPTPAEMNATVSGVNANGQPIARPRVDAAPMYGGSGQPIAGSGGANQPPTGLSPGESKLQEERATAANTYDTALTEINTVGQENLRVLREMQDAMKAFKTGGGMAVREKLGGMLDALGFPKNVVDAAAGGDRGAIQEFQKLAVRYATQEMKTNMGSGQRFTNLDFSTFLKNNPTIETDPRGLDKMFKFLEQGVWRAGQQQDEHSHWKTGWRPRGYENTGMDSFPAWWTKVLANANKKD